MGSSRSRHSSGRKAGAFRKSSTTRANKTQARPDVDAILGRLSDSLSIIATATNALVHAQQPTGTVTPADVGEEITTLEHGVRALRATYDELDVALRELRP